MLSDVHLMKILDAAPKLKIGVLGDLFLDRYLDLDASLTEPSLETGLDAYQVTRVRSYPGAAGTVINNLVAFGVGKIVPLAILGDDGEGYELRQALGNLAGVDSTQIFTWPDRRTPTYTKPMLIEGSPPGRELHRLDIKNRAPLPTDAEDEILLRLEALLGQVDGLLVLDQVSEANTGVVTARVRDWLAGWGVCHAHPLILADSRENIGRFRNVWIKPNERECLQAGQAGVREGIQFLAERSQRPVFCTQGERGIQGYDPKTREAFHAPAYRVDGPIDIVGAGDSTNAALMAALLAGVGFAEAAGFANLVASITIQQLGTTGTASPEQIWRRWEEVKHVFV